MSTIRAITLITANPSRGSSALNTVLGWKIDADFGTFASVTPPASPPVWLNAPNGDEVTSSGLILHVSTSDVDASFNEAISRGANTVRGPSDMDYGERSAMISINELPGVIFDFSLPGTEG